MTTLRQPRRTGYVKRWRFCVLCSDVMLDEDFVVARFSRRQRARDEADRLNAKYLRLFRGWDVRNVPRFYCVREATLVREKGKVAS